MAFYGYWSGDRYTAAERDFQLWEVMRYSLSQIQGFEFELRDMLESYAILSKQAIALGRSDLLDEALAGVKRVNVMKENWVEINEITEAYYHIWPNLTDRSEEGTA